MLTCTVYASSPDPPDMSGQLGALGLENLELPKEAEDALGIPDFEGISLDSGINLLLSYGADSFGGLFKQALAQAAVVLVIVLLCGVCETVYEPINKEGSNIIPLVGSLAVTAAVAMNFSSLAGTGRNAIDTLFLFSKGLLASVAAATGVLGAPVTAAGKYAATLLFADALISVIDKILMPILYAYIAVVAASAAIGEGALDKLAKFLKWLCVSVMSVLLTAFVAYVTVSGVVSGGADAMAVKATKTVLSSAIPVVGSIISDAAETVIASARVVRNAAGLVGILGILAICVAPFLRLGLQYLLFRAAGAASSPLAGGRIAKLIEDLAGAFGILLGMLGACALLMLVATVSFIHVAGGM